MIEKLKVYRLTCGDCRTTKIIRDVPDVGYAVRESGFRYGPDDVLCSNCFEQLVKRMKEREGIK